MSRQSEETGRSQTGVSFETGEQEASTAASGRRDLFHRPLIHLILIVILGLLVYSNTFHSPFQWDEEKYIMKNPVVHDLGYFLHPAEASGSRFYDALKGRYIGYLTFALNYHFERYNVTGYHVVNLAIHLTNAILVYLLIILTFKTPYFRWQSAWGIAQQAGKHQAEDRNPPLSPLILRGDEGGGRFKIQDPRSLIALFVALFFVAHPLQTEAVTYIFQRLASLVTMFYLLSMVFYIKGRLKGTSRQVARNKRETGSGNEELAASGQQGESHKVQAGNTEGPNLLLRTSNLKPLTSRFSVISYYILSFLFAVLAMKTKENAFTLPVMITLYELYFFDGPLKKRILRLVPLLLTLLIIPATLIGTGKPAGEVISQVKDPAAFGFKGYSTSVYLLTQFRVIVTYLRLLLFPVNQDLNYSYPAYHSLSQPAVLLSFLLLLFLMGLAGYLLIKSKGHRAKGTEQETEDSNPPFSPLKIRGDRGGLCLKIRGDRNLRRDDGEPLEDCSERYALCSKPSAPYYRLISFGILWFFVTLSVESSIIPIPMLMDEYRVYLPSVGVFTAIITALFVIVSGQGRGLLPRAGKRAAAILVVIMLLFSGATYARNNVWRSQISLWKDVVSKSPEKASGYNNLGIAYGSKNQYEKAIEMYTKAIGLYPPYVEAYSNRGLVYGKTGRLDNAIWDFNKAIALSPSYAGAYANRGIIFQMRDDFDKAIKDYTRAIKLNPNLNEAYYNRGMLYEKTGRLNRALSDLNRVIQLGQHDTVAAYRGRAMVLEKMGRTEEAKEEYIRAIELKPSDEEAYVRLGILYGKSGSFDKAIEYFNRAIAIKPGDGVAYNDRGYAYFLMGRYDNALKDFNEAIAINPGHVSAYVHRGNLYLRTGDRERAVQDLQNACRLKDEGACRTLQTLLRGNGK